MIYGNVRALKKLFEFDLVILLYCYGLPPNFVGGKHTIITIPILVSFTVIII